MTQDFRTPTMNRTLRAAAIACLSALAPALACAATPRANDFPTAERVIYVQDCIKAHPGPHFEMLNKCSCALDAMASEIRYDDYVAMTTVVNAISIGGERGSGLRDNETVKPQLKRFRDLQAKVQKACLIESR
jgi:hypothetical protein